MHRPERLCGAVRTVTVTENRGCSPSQRFRARFFPALLAAQFSRIFASLRCEATTIHGRSVLEVFRSHRRIFTAVENSKWKGNTRAENRAETERLPGDRLWQDKANWRSLAPSGRKGLSAHWFSHLAAPSERHSARCHAAALRNFPFDFNCSSDGSAMCAEEGARRLFALPRVDAI
jgi:hypothetical protein